MMLDRQVTCDSTAVVFIEFFQLELATNISRYPVICCVSDRFAENRHAAFSTLASWLDFLTSSVLRSGSASGHPTRFKLHVHSRTTWHCVLMLRHASQ